MSEPILKPLLGGWERSNLFSHEKMHERRSRSNYNRATVRVGSDGLWYWVVWGHMGSVLSKMVEHGVARTIQAAQSEADAVLREKTPELGGWVPRTERPGQLPIWDIRDHDGRVRGTIIRNGPPGPDYIEQPDVTWAWAAYDVRGVKVADGSELSRYKAEKLVEAHWKPEGTSWYDHQAKITVEQAQKRQEEERQQKLEAERQRKTAELEDPLARLLKALED